MRRTGPSDLIRRRGQRPERQRILIVTEGRETEPQYFKGLARFARATGLSVYPADVIGVGRDPCRVVATAIRRRDEDRSPRDQYDDVWCVFDVDQHNGLESAVAQARRELIRVAISNPCFELWLLWHFVDLFSETNAAELQRRLKKYGLDGKALPSSFAYQNHAVAIRRAEQNIVAPYDVPTNPGTSVSVVARLVAGR